MLKNSGKIFLIAAATILLPITLFVVYEVSSLQEDEEVIQRIYQNQLDFVIFSANQYSNDFLDNLISSIEEDLDEDGLDLGEKSRALMSYSGCLFLNFRALDSLQPKSTNYYPSEKPEGYDQLINELYLEQEQLIWQLVEYRKNGYRKIEPNKMVEFEGLELQVLFAILTDPSGKYFLMTGLIEPNTFANEVLSPRLQQVAQEDLVVSLFNREKDVAVFITDSIFSDIIASKQMWLFPSLELGISLKNRTIKDLIDERLKYNLIASGLLILLLFTGFGLIGRNIYKQMQLAQTKSDFVSNVSHELRTPLALISMFAETLLLQRVKKEEKKTEYIEIIYKETSRLTRIVNRILNFSQIDANQKKYRFAELDVNAVIDELLHDYSFHLEQNGFGFEFVKESEELIISADKESIYEALVNLMDNAIKYSKEEKFITIRTLVNDEGAVIEVSDKGIGIPKEKAKQVFDKFYRVSEGDVHNVQGAGLGLSLVASIMEAHGGFIDVESTFGKGSTFRLVFKLA